MADCINRELRLLDYLRLAQRSGYGCSRRPVGGAALSLLLYAADCAQDQPLIRLN